MANNYVSATKQGSKLSTLKPDEIQVLFIRVGWIGELREKPPAVRLAPFFDKGPGLR
jgi:hypothetical protein